MRFSFGILAFLLLFAILLSGCISEEDAFDARLACLRLSTPASLAIPKCETQSECLQNLESAFSEFETKNISFQSRQQVFEYKNYLAKSWLQFNRANAKLAQINQLCRKPLSLEQLPSLVNEVKADLLLSFEALDSANKAAIASLAMERDFLERQEIRMASEEGLFDAFVLLQSQFNELILNSYQSQPGFVSDLHEGSRQLESVFSKQRLKQGFVSSHTLLDLVPKDWTPFISDSAERNVFFPVFFSAIEDFASTWSQNALTLSAINEMSDFPVFEFGLAYEKLAGTQNASPQEFFRLLDAVSRQKGLLQSSNEGLLKKISLQLPRLEEAVSSLDTGELDSLDSKLISDLWSDSGNRNKIQTASFAFTDFQSAQSDLESKLEELRNRILEFNGQSARGELTLGETTFLLKRISSELDALESNVHFLKTDVVDGVLELCEAKKKQIKQDIGKVEATDSQLQLLATRVSFYWDLFESESAVQARFSYCGLGLEAFSEYETALENREAFLLEFEAKTADCAEFADAAFGLQPELFGSQVSLYNQWLQLKERQSDADELALNCVTLKNALQTAFEKSQTVREIEGNFDQANSFAIGAEKLIRLSGNPVPEKLDQGLEKIAVFFIGNKLVFEKSLAKLGQIERDAAEAKSNLEKTWKKELAAYLASRYQVRTPGKLLKANADNEIDSEIVFRNDSGIALEEELAVSLDWPSAAGSQVVGKSPWISQASILGSKLQVLFDRIPVGESAVSIRETWIPVFLESDKILSASCEKLSVERTFKPSFEHRTALIRIESQLAPKGIQIGETAVLQNGLEAQYWIADQNLVFDSVTYPFPKTIAFFSLYEPIKRTDSVTENANGIQKTVLLGNRLAMEIPHLGVAIPKPAVPIDDVEATDAGGKALLVTQRQTEWIVDAGLIAPAGAKTIFIEFRTDEPAELALQAKETLVRELAAEIETGNPEAKELLSELLDASADTKTGREKIFSLEQEWFESQKKQALLEEQQARYIELNAVVQDRIRALESELALLSASSDSALRAALSETISKAKAQALKAELLFSDNQPGPGLTAIRSVLGLLGEPGSELSAGILSEKDSLWKRYRKVQEFSGEHQLDLNIDFDSKWSLLDRLVAAKDFNQSRLVLHEISVQLDETEADANRQLETLVKEWQAKLEQAREIFPGKLRQKIGLIEQWLEEGVEKDFIRMGILSPVSTQSLQAIEKGLDSKGSWNAKKIESFESASDSNLFEAALSSMVTEKKPIEARLAALSGIGKQLDSYVAWFSNTAGLELEKAKAWGSEHGLSTEGSKQLFLAQKQFEERDFGKAIVNSREIRQDRSAALIGLGFLDALPSAVIPVLAGIGLLGVWKLTRKKNQPAEKQKIRVERISNPF